MSKPVRIPIVVNVVGKRTNYRKRVVETLQLVPKRSFVSSDGNLYLVSGFWSREARGLIRKLLCETFVIVQPVGIWVRDLPSYLRDEAIKSCNERGIDHPGNRTLYTVDRRRLNQVNRDLLMQSTPIVIVKGVKRCDDVLTFDQQQTLDVYTWPADPT